MDVPLQLFTILFFIAFSPCFNPCFNGCSSSTLKGKIILFDEEEVSILVLMDVPLQHYR